MTADEVESIASTFASERMKETPARVGPAKKSQRHPSKWLVVIEWKPPPGVKMDGGDSLVEVDDETGMATFYGT